MTKDDVIQKISSYYEDDVNVAALIEIILDYGQGEEGDVPSDMYIKRLANRLSSDWWQILTASGMHTPAATSSS